MWNQDSAGQQSEGKQKSAADDERACFHQLPRFTLNIRGGIDLSVATEKRRHFTTKQMRQAILFSSSGDLT